MTKIIVRARLGKLTMYVLVQHFHTNNEYNHRLGVCDCTHFSYVYR